MASYSDLRSRLPSEPTDIEGVKPRRRASRLALVAIGLSAALALVGCTEDLTVTPPAAGDSGAESNDADAGEGGGSGTPGESGTSSIDNATLMMAGQSFTFSTTSCIVTGDDVVVRGPGRDDDSGEPAFLDIDLVKEGLFRVGAIRIELGTDQPFVSMDRFLQAQIGGDDEYSVYQDGDTLVIEGIFKLGGEASWGPGTVEASC